MIKLFTVKTKRGSVILETDDISKARKALEVDDGRYIHYSPEAISIINNREAGKLAATRPLVFNRIMTALIGHNELPTFQALCFPVARDGAALEVVPTIDDDRAPIRGTRH